MREHADRHVQKIPIVNKVIRVNYPEINFLSF